MQKLVCRSHGKLPMLYLRDSVASENDAINLSLLSRLNLAIYGTAQRQLDTCMCVNSEKCAG